MSVRRVFALLAFACAAALSASPAAAEGACASCGVVQSIQMSTQEEQWTPLGVVASPSTATSAARTDSRTMLSFDGRGGSELVMVGAAGGAVYAKRPTSYQRPRWDVTVRMDAGGTRTVQQRYEPFVREGDHVRISGTQVELVDP